MFDEVRTDKDALREDIIGFCSKNPDLKIVQATPMKDFFELADELIDRGWRKEADSEELRLAKEVILKLRQLHYSPYPEVRERAEADLNERLFGQWRVVDDRLDGRVMDWEMKDGV